jgi:hypothetical protein
MKTFIQDMTTDEIVNYLRFKRESLIFNFFDRVGVKDNFEVSMSKKEWKDFTEFCLRKDVDGIFDLTEFLLNIWNENKEMFPNDYRYSK